jgi:hypothetical protein
MVTFAEFNIGSVRKQVYERSLSRQDKSGSSSEAPHANEYAHGPFEKDNIRVYKDNVRATLATHIRP